MRNTAVFGALLGWASLVIGAGCIAIGVFAGGSPDYAELARCERDLALGRRISPCTAPPDRWLLLSAGGGAMASGMFFLLLSGILGTLLDMREDAQKAAREREAEAWRAARAADAPAGAESPTRYIKPGAPLSSGGRIGDPPAIQTPSRFDMITRHGEAVGGPAWDLMRQAAKAGIALPEAEAVRKVREEPRHD